MNEADLLTGRELVGQLERLGIGTWTPDAVRQWIRELPACPIAQAADQGKPHRYRLAQVLDWLRTRTAAERQKGYARGDGLDLLQRIDAAVASLSAPAMRLLTAPVTEKELFLARNTTAPQGDGSAPAATGVPPEKPSEPWSADPTNMPDPEVLMEVIRGRDARQWKAAEEARAVRLKRLEAERKLIPIAELEMALAENVEHTRREVIATAPIMKTALREFIPVEQRVKFDDALDEEIAHLFSRLASDADLADATVSPAKPLGEELPQ